MKRTNHFNLIELMLAAAIIMVACMFAVSLSATASKTMAMNGTLANVAETVEKVSALLRSNDYMFGGFAPCTSDEGKRIDDYPKADEEITDANVLKMEIIPDNNGNAFLCRKFRRIDDGSYVVEFAATVRTLAIDSPDPDKFYYWRTSDETWAESSELAATDYGKYFKSVILEIAWPAHADYDKRNIRRVRIDAYNRQFVSNLFLGGGE
ncbi:MAG: hypothetical protein MJ025_05735 [Victivallaceae bacterium]|nr:hypothetical protein [Victivallaceae bacterium]